ncbi:hypothetical protein DUT91_15520 [Phyllobacterium salinisoli]|uniref:YfdX family protein n=1 Tax=Phyllobacterium salinisoli TaxID=1899321 RepID=A0A368K340_9HYPH|nr:YfdX family protein [Phyllobacterium salinisoli]RCS22893.1 hypothetical protein DUT91_15520 [Phyllobacterium salinisoli]
MKSGIFSAFLLSATILSSSVTVPAFAQEPNAAATQQSTQAQAAQPQAAKPSPAQLAAMKKLNLVSNEGFEAVRGIALARLAIFQGQPDRANDILKTVKQNLDKAQASTTDLAAKLKQADGPQDEVDAIQSGQIPIDFSVGVNDDYTVTPENAQHIQNANKHLDGGNTQQAAEELKLANVDIFVTETDAKLPDLVKAVDAATAQLASKQYYEANLSLMKADAAISVRAISEDKNEAAPAKTGAVPTPTPAPTQTK